MIYRPEGWKRFKFEAHIDDDYMEAGADAMLEALKLNSVKLKAGEPFCFAAPSNGSIAFIPEDNGT